MITNMTGFRWFSKFFASLCFGRKYSLSIGRIKVISKNYRIKQKFAKYAKMSYQLGSNKKVLYLMFYKKILLREIYHEISQTFSWFDLSFNVLLTENRKINHVLLYDLSIHVLLCFLGKWWGSHAGHTHTGKDSPQPALPQLQVHSVQGEGWGKPTHRKRRYKHVFAFMNQIIYLIFNFFIYSFSYLFI